MIDTTGRAPQRPEIDISWRRSTLSGLEPDSSPKHLIDEDLASQSALLRAARPVFDSAADQLTDSGIALILTDPESRIVSITYGGAQVEHGLSRIGGVRGAHMSEDSVGTTALGTPVETRTPITVNGAEHYLETYKHLSCYGMPIIHPTTQRLAGVLCMTAVGDHAHPLFAPTVRRFADDIAAQLLDATHASHRLALAAFQSASRRRDVAVVALGDDLQLTNTTATDLLDAADLGVLRSLTTAARTGVPSSITLASGITVGLAAEPIAGATAAAVFVITPLDARRGSVPRSTPLTSPITVDVGIDLGARGTARALAVLGEPGSGRTHRAMAAVPATGVESFDVPRSLAGLSAGLPASLAAADRTGAALLVDGVELLADHDLALLRQTVLARMIPVIAIGSADADQRASVAALLALCDERVDLTPLRRRPHDLTAFAQHFLNRTPNATRLGAGVSDALSAHDWPGNLVELERTMAVAMASATGRGSRLIELDDLPARYRATSRAGSLTLMERTERQSIVDALDRCRGNKAHAAKHLGISRSTLYLRIKALGIAT